MPNNNITSDRDNYTSLTSNSNIVHTGTYTSTYIPNQVVNNLDMITYTNKQTEYMNFIAELLGFPSYEEFILLDDSDKQSIIRDKKINDILK